ncbi:MAG: retention module-containing protein, partial [Methylococcales bacterium]|nr:retention module-containing protein [Methylococcales bacterium]
MANSGIVQAVSGVVKAIGVNGIERVLQVGDRVSPNEQILTGDAGTIAIEFSDGTSMDLGRNANVTLNDDALNPDGATKQAGQTAAEAQDEVAAIQQALASGEAFDPSKLAATAAGGAPAAGGTGEDDGSTIVNVDYLNPDMTPDNGFDTTGISNTFLEPQGEFILNPVTPVIPVVPPSLSIDDVTVTEPDDYVQAARLEGDQGGDEPSVVATFTVTLSELSDVDVTVNFVTADGTAISGGSGIAENDYGSTNGTLTIPAGSSSATIEVLVFGDHVTEISEQYFVTLSDPVNATIADDTGIGTILDSAYENDSVSYAITESSTVTEGNVTTVTYTVTQTGTLAPGVSATVDYATANGSATAGSDYTAVSDSLTFTSAANGATQTFNVTILNDAITEDTEAYTVSLSNPSSNASITVPTVTTTILDNDSVSYAITESSTVTEGNVTTVTYTVTQTGTLAPGVSATVDYATANG